MRNRVVNIQSAPTVHVKNSPSKGDASVNIKSVMGEGKMMKEFTIAAAKPLPVIVLADVSGSMAENGKIEALNIALKDMIRTFAGESRLRADIQVGLITFGGPQATLHLPPAPCSKIADFPDLSAAGRTPMGHAFALAREVIEDRTLITLGCCHIELGRKAPTRGAPGASMWIPRR